MRESNLTGSESYIDERQVLNQDHQYERVNPASIDVVTFESLLSDCNHS
jgi:hypothetical protein